MVRSAKSQKWGLGDQKVRRAVLLTQLDNTKLSVQLSNAAQAVGLESHSVIQNSSGASGTGAVATPLANCQFNHVRRLNGRR